MIDRVANDGAGHRVIAAEWRETLSCRERDVESPAAQRNPVAPGDDGFVEVGVGMPAVDIALAPDAGGELSVFDGEPPDLEHPDQPEPAVERLGVPPRDGMDEPDSAGAAAPRDRAAPVVYQQPVQAAAQHRLLRRDTPRTTRRGGHRDRHPEEGGRPATHPAASRAPSEARR